MSAVTVIARIVALPGRESLIRAALLKLIEPTRAEAGCVNYDLHVTLDDPAVFYFHENWTSADALDAHLASDHLQAALAEMHGAFDSVDIQRMERVDDSSSSRAFSSRHM